MISRTNEEWLEDLTGPSQEQAIEDLRAILVRGLTYALSARIKTDLEETIQDFVQDALVRIMDNIHTFRGESKFTTWAQKIAVRVAFTELRRKRWENISLQDLIPEDSDEMIPSFLADPSPDPEKRVNQIMLTEMIADMLNNELTEKQRTALIAVLGGGMPLDEVARRLDTNRNALYKLIHDARKHMRNLLRARGMTPQEVLKAFEES
jgi:RNA polymerase sigma-70 factor (ECF subfamily)